MMTKGEKDIAELTQKWMTEITKIATKTETAIGKLKDAKDEYVASKKSWHNSLKELLIPYAPLIILIVAGILMSLLKCGDNIKIPGGFEFNKTCATPPIKVNQLKSE